MKKMSGNMEKYEGKMKENMKKYDFIFLVPSYFLHISSQFLPILRQET